MVCVAWGFGAIYRPVLGFCSAAVWCNQGRVVGANSWSLEERALRSGASHCKELFTRGLCEREASAQAMDGPMSWCCTEMRCELESKEAG